MTSHDHSNLIAIQKNVYEIKISGRSDFQTKV